MNDPITTEVRRVRQELSDRFHDDVHEMAEFLRKVQENALAAGFEEAPLEPRIDREADAATHQ